MVKLHQEAEEREKNGEGKKGSNEDLMDEAGFLTGGPGSLIVDPSLGYPDYSAGAPDYGNRFGGLSGYQ
jgi:hypothetical protein